MSLTNRVKRLWRAVTDRTAERRRLTEKRRREAVRRFEGRAAVVLRFIEAVPPERVAAVDALLAEHREWLLNDEYGEGESSRPSLVRAVHALARGSSWFPDPLPTPWLDLHLDNPDAEDAAGCDCRECGLIHPARRNYTVPAATPWRAPDGTTRTVPAGAYYQSYPLCPDWRCVVCGGGVACNGYYLKHSARRLPAPLAELLLADGGGLEHVVNPDDGESYARLIRPAVDPIAEYHPEGAPC